MRPLISLTSDFGVQTQGIGNMKGVALGINPDANVINLMHGLPDFDIRAGARTMETVFFLPIGYHVCVVDPGVGTSRKPIIIQTNRGDYLIGPDNGVLIPATRILGGIKKIVEITNEKYMRKPVSPIFHGRDIFTPAAAWLSKGIPIEEFGPELNDLVPAPYEEVVVKDNVIEAEIISINKFGSFHLNISHSAWDEFNAKDTVELKFNDQSLKVPIAKTFGEVAKGKPLIMKDDYNRVEVALNMDSFAKKYSIKTGDKIIIKK